MALIDVNGNPLKAAPKKDLTTEQSAPTLTGVRSIWNEQVASGLTPARLARVLRESGEVGGQIVDYLTLAEEMEERDPQYRMALTQRKLAIRNIEPVIEPASEEEDDKIIADHVRKLLDTTGFRNVLMHLADAIAKGFAAAEIIWKMDGARWFPEKILARDPRHFQFDRISGRELRLREDGDIEGSILPPAKYIGHVPSLKSGLPIRQGVARTAMWIFMLKSFSLKDWMAFLEVYGMPFRVGKYGPGATQDDKRALLRAVANVAADGGAIIPESMKLEFIETKAGNAGDNAFRGMAEYLDEQFSKLVLGQTMTGDDGSSEAQANIHNDIRLLILRADGDDLAATIQRDLVNHYVAFNFGQPKNGFPQVTFPVPDPEDLKLLLEATKTFVDMGGTVPAGPVREKLGWRAANAGEEILGAKPVPVDPRKEKTTEALRRLFDKAAVPLMIAADDITEGFADEISGEWEEQLSPLMEAIRKAAAEAGDFPSFMKALESVSSETAPLNDRLAAATFVARIMGSAANG
jgi:phage gp29-like protein